MMMNSSPPTRQAHVHVPDILAEAGGQFLQHLVACVMAVCVIYRLEEIYVDGER